MPGVERETAVQAFHRMGMMLGALGLALPFILILGGLFSKGGMEPSISDYYHTLMRDAFVGVMTATGLFLIAWPGYPARPGDRISDDALTTIAGIAAFGVAYFPNEMRMNANLLGSITQQMLGYKLAAVVHYGSAIVFLGALTGLCFWRFPREARKRRGWVFRFCGLVILQMTIATIVASWFKIRGPEPLQRLVNETMMVLWFEAIAVWAFAFAWILKSRVSAMRSATPAPPD